MDIIYPHRAKESLFIIPRALLLCTYLPCPPLPDGFAMPYKQKKEDVSSEYIKVHEPDVKCE